MKQSKPEEGQISSGWGIKKGFIRRQLLSWAFRGNSDAWIRGLPGGVKSSSKDLYVGGWGEVALAGSRG